MFGTAALARAALAARLVQLAPQRPRAELVGFAAEFLNAGGDPGCAPDAGDAAFAARLEDFFTQGAGAPGLTGEERALLRCGGALGLGAACLAVLAGEQLFGLAPGVVALSAEVLKADLRGLEREATLAGPRGAAAGELRALLEGSATLQGGGKSGLADPALIGAAQGVAAVRENLKALSLAAKLELEAGLPTPQRSSKGLACPGHLPSAQLPVLLAAVAQSALPAAAASVVRARLCQERLGALASEQQAPRPLLAGVLAQLSSMHAEQEGALRRAAEEAHRAAAADNATGCGGALACLASLQAVQGGLELEALAACSLARLQQGPVAAPKPTQAPGSAAAAPPVELDEAAKKKAAKEAKKAAKKAAKKGGGGGCSKGAAMMQTFVEAAAAGAGGLAAAKAAEDGEGVPYEHCLRALCPESSEGGAEEDEGTAPERAAALARGLGEALAWSGSALPRVTTALQALAVANAPRRKPKIAKGARDFLPEQMAIREKAFATIINVFKRHGAVSIDTPVFELRETLTGKYGEDSKLIYDLADQGGEALSLRYDLTVPFARYVALNNTGNIKRYHIARVYRRDQPQMNRGRFREFFQCDFDIAGTYPSMVPDAEVLKVLTEALTQLDLGEFVVKLNHRGILDGMMDVCGVPPQKFRPICSAIDKLDKEPWEEVRREMVEDKGLDGAAADRIGEIVALKGSPGELLARLQNPVTPLLKAVAAHPQVAKAMGEMETLFGFLGAMDALGDISFDLSLARGLDYYTGLIYEAVLVGAGVGSIAAGGRYDGLVGMFSGKDVPAIGMSVGIERIFSILEARMRAKAEAEGKALRSTETQVLVASIGSGLQTRRMEVCSRLWSAGIKAEFGFKTNPKMGDQLNYTLEQGIPYMVLFGEDEIEAGQVKIKDMAAKEETAIPLGSLVEELQRRLGGTSGGERAVAC